MIPLKLSVRNFMCYRDNVPELHLAGFRVACLCGPNGNGKSALLDAITWALWGAARGRSQDELIHQGQKEMRVELEFSARGSVYRVVRRHARKGLKGGGATSLELQIAGADSFRSISGNTVRDTEAKIREILGMDYDTFINSAFLLQGRADEFTNKPPAERKQVLANILRLGQYERLEDRAKSRAREVENLARQLDGKQEALQTELARRGGYEEALRQATSDFTKVDTEARQRQEQESALQQRVQRLRQRQERAKELAQRIAQADAEVTSLQQRSERRKQTIHEYQELLDKKTQVADGLRQLEETRRAEEELALRQAKSAELSRRRLPLEEAIARARGELTAHSQLLQRHIDADLRPKAGSLPSLEQELASANQRSQALHDHEEQLRQQEEQAQALSTQVQHLIAQEEVIKREGQELKAKLTLLHHPEEGARCPLCNSPLGEAEHRRLADLYNQQIQEKAKAYKETQGQRQQQEADLASLQKSVTQLSERLKKDARELEARRARTQERLSESQRATEELKAALHEMEGLQTKLSQGHYALEAKQSLAAVQKELDSLAYDPDAHQKVRHQLRSLASFEDLHRRVQEAEERLPRETQDLEYESETIRRRQQEMEQDQREQQAIQEEVASLASLEGELRNARADLQRLGEQRDRTLALKGDLEGKLGRLRDVEVELHAARQESQHLREEQGIFGELATAFGKRGIQALLIEAATPELESLANELLGRMTDNRMSIKLETQKEHSTPAGPPVETLEIRVADELGTRSYETFSGGEAFRINLALRIALSKLLARRAGAPLPTLFIDEGFGSQDSAGREKILDVIRAIENDFERIIVITHLDELKEAFPVRIEVQKTEAGSTFWVS